LSKAILEVTKPSVTSLLVLAKILATGKSAPFDQHMQINFAASSSADVLSAGMLALSCAIGNQNIPPSFTRIAQTCIDHAVDCAPYSAMLLALLVARAGKLMTISDFAPKFIDLLGHGRPDVRAATAVLLGESKDQGALPRVMAALADKAAIVRKYAVWGAARLLRLYPDAAALSTLRRMAEDADAGVRAAEEAALPGIEKKGADSADHASGQGQMLRQLLDSVKRCRFAQRMKTDAMAADGA
jgi:hypothetical protein